MDHKAVLTYVIVIVSRIPVCLAMYCDEFDSAAKVCQINEVSDSKAVHLDTYDVPLLSTVMCTCTLEVIPFIGCPDIIVTPSRNDPGGIALEVDGVNVAMTQSTDTVLPYKPSMLIRFVKTTNDRESIQCFEFRASSRIKRIFIKCMHQRPPTPPASTSTTTDTSRLTAHTTSPSYSTSSAPPTSTNATIDVGHENDSTSKLVAVYAVVPTVALVLVVAVVIFVLVWRRRTQSCGKSTEIQDYVNTGNLDLEETTPNDDGVPLYENEANRNVNRKEQNYSALEHQREPTNEHTYSDLTNDANADSVTENEQESNRLVYGNDYSSSEPRPEQGTYEHQYSGLETRRDIANSLYENTDSVYENQQF